jgi:DMSO/TMAO reductase YedYZ molybdopterin-dependent catalytic subunit
MKKSIEVTFLLLISMLMISVSWAWSANEIREYEGKRLSPFNRDYDNSIKGPQTVNINTYRLEVGGLVRHPLSLSYKEILAMPSVKRTIVLHCVEGWDETLLFKGVRFADLIKNADLKKEVKTVIFYAADGYSSSLTYEDIRKKDMMIAYEINGISLDATRGFPLQVVAESKLGYKWVKWVTRIELSDKPYKGYWENRGYDNEADINTGKK